MFVMGTTFTNWIKLLVENNFKVSWKRLHKVLLITVIIIILTPLSIIERLIIHPRVRNTKVKKPPVFILGHWRSGTTHLHNMFTIDNRLSYPNMVDTLFPNHMVLSKWLLRPLLSLALPEKRPMDNMKLSVDVPGEHDWAISNFCLMSPYSGAYFPNHWEHYRKYANFDDATTKEKQLYIKYLRFYLQKLTYKYGDDRQIVLKSPMDTARARLLREIFPDARFIHIYRNPYEVFFSTKKLHTKNKDIYPLQEDNRDLDEFVLSTYEDMFEEYFKDRELIPDDQVIEVKFEELIQDRMEMMSQIYDHLDLPNFEGVRDDLYDYVKTVNDYERDEYVIKKEDKDMIYNRLAFAIDRWDYDVKIKN